MMMLFLRSSILLALLLVLPLAAARDVSLYSVPDFFESDELAAQQPNEEALLKEVGLEQAQVQANHPAAHPDVPQIRAAMQGLKPNDVAVPAMTTVSKSPPHALQQSSNDAGDPLLQQQQQQQQQHPGVGAVKQSSSTQAQPGAVKQIGGSLPGPKQQPKTAVTATPKQQTIVSKGGAPVQQQPGGLRANAPKYQPLLKQGALNGTAGGPGVPKTTPKSPQSPQSPQVSNAAVPKQINPHGTAAVPPQAMHAAGASASPPNKLQRVLPPQQQVGPAPVQARSATEEASEEDVLPEFDFIVAGFPKCGTTTLLKSFEAHPEIAMAGSEQCAVAAPSQPDAIVLKKLDETLKVMVNSDAGEALSLKKRAFKCPTAVYNYKSIIRLEKHSPGSRLVVGIRHPVKMMMSFYNYRVAELYQRGLHGTEPIPNFLDLLEDPLSVPWKGVSMESVRFEKFLQQLGKTHMTVDAFAALAETESYELAVKPSNFQIFLYEISQLEDTDEERSAILREELQMFLGLSTPLAPFGKENVNHVASDADAAPTETISICDAQYAHIRAALVENAKETTEWLSEHFLDSPDVTVANPEHFRALLNDYTVDPCDETPPATDAALVGEQSAEATPQV